MPAQHTHTRSVKAAGFTFAVEVSADAPLELGAEVEAAGDAHLLHLHAARADGGAFTLEQFALRWDVPAVDMHGFLSGLPTPEELIRLPYWEVKKASAANLGLPFVALIHRGGENRAAFGLLDQLTETALDATLSEHTRSYHFHWHKPNSPARPSVTAWRETLFISGARKPWPQIVADYSAAVDAAWPQPRLPVPDSAYDPVYCTWTAIHHEVSQDWVLRNARIAADLGFGTWLTDDGWFTEKAMFADYRYTGDWQAVESKFPDFAGHVRAVQDMGMRYVLWVAPFMVGDESVAAQTHADLLTGHSERLRVSSLSPWHARSGEAVGVLLARIVAGYGLDGLKLDFLDFIPMDAARPADSPYHTFGEAFYHTMSAAIDHIARQKPDLLVEFRARYTNLASRRYGNCYRAADVPINPAMNRWQVVMSRLLTPDRAAQFDPALWHPADSDENVAVQLINSIIGVPMVSVELETYPQAHLDLIQTWMAFYNQHRAAILHGAFRPEFHLGRVPLIRFDGAEERIVGLYDDLAFALEDGPLPLWVLNASCRPYVELLPGRMPGTLAGTHRVITQDKFGKTVSEASVEFPTARLAVEIGGRLKIG